MYLRFLASIVLKQKFESVYIDSCAVRNFSILTMRSNKRVAYLLNNNLL